MHEQTGLCVYVCIYIYSAETSVRYASCLCSGRVQHTCMPKGSSTMLRLHMQQATHDVCALEPFTLTYGSVDDIGWRHPLHLTAFLM